MGFLGLWSGVLQVISGRWRGANGAFCREIPRFLDGARVRRGDSAYGGRYRAVGTKNFLKKGWKIKNLGCFSEIKVAKAPRR